MNNSDMRQIVLVGLLIWVTLIAFLFLDVAVKREPTYVRDPDGAWVP